MDEGSEVEEQVDVSELQPVIEPAEDVNLPLEQVYKYMFVVNTRTGTIYCQNLETSQLEIFNTKEVEQYRIYCNEFHAFADEYGIELVSGRKVS